MMKRPRQNPSAYPDVRSQAESRRDGSPLKKKVQLHALQKNGADIGVLFKNRDNPLEGSHPNGFAPLKQPTNYGNVSPAAAYSQKNLHFPKGSIDYERTPIHFGKYQEPLFFYPSFFTNASPDNP
ncbi:unnamed protein product [Vicia faba]|uniref:Uncharacterized protein n=1 Tax=Vicia faba TaxID=3906 RepID=A0AAV1ANE5_VICFA|nr:unnamed protein product [Vicia faba]